MYWTEDFASTNWNKIEENVVSPIFDYDKWEPGYTDVKYIKIEFVGSSDAGKFVNFFEIAVTGKESVA